MFDCCLVESYGRKKRQKKRVQVWCTGSSDLWNLGTEAPPSDPKSNNQTKKERSKAISMVVDMETEGGLKRRAVMVVAKKNWLAHAKLLYYKIKIFFFCYVLLLNRELGLSISSGFFSRKKTFIYSPSIFI